MARVFRSSMQILLAAWLGGFCPSPAQAGFFSLSEQDEVAIGRQAASQVEQQVRLLRDEAVQAYITSLGLDLARASARPNLPWRFRVIQDKRINAFALPGGFIYVHSRILETAKTEAELASVIAHEIGHVEGRHHKAQIERAMRYQFGLGVLGAVLGQGGGADYAMIAGKLLVQGQLTKYSREAENDADRRGVVLLYRVGYDPMAMSRYLANLLALDRGESGILSDFFASHPAASDRVASTQAQARALPARGWRQDSPGFRSMRRHLLGGAGELEDGARLGREAEDGARILPRPPAPLGGARIRPRWE